MSAWGSSWGASWSGWGDSGFIPVQTNSSTGGAGKSRKLRILPDGTRLFATEREIQAILRRFYQYKAPAKTKAEKKAPKVFEVSMTFPAFEKYIPKTYVLKTGARPIQADYVAFIEGLKKREEEEFMFLLEGL